MSTLDSLLQTSDEARAVEIALHESAVHFGDFSRIPLIHLYSGCNHYLQGARQSDAFVRLLKEKFPHVKVQVRNLGDWTQNAPGLFGFEPDYTTIEENHLREAKNLAKEESLKAGKKVSVEEAESLVWRDPKYTNGLAWQWGHIDKPTMKIMRHFSQLVNEGIVIGDIVDSSGNDYDKGRRYIIAENLFNGVPLEYAFSGPQAGTIPLEEKMSKVTGIRRIDGPEFYRHGRAVELALPYLENKSSEERAHYVRQIRDFLKAHGHSISQILITGHQPFMLELRREEGNQAYNQVFEAIDAEAPHLWESLQTISTHTHRNTPPQTSYLPRKTNFQSRTDLFNGFRATQIGYHDQRQSLPSDKDDANIVVALYQGSIPENHHRLAILVPQDPAGLDGPGLKIVNFPLERLIPIDVRTLRDVKLPEIGKRYDWGLNL